MKEKKKQGMIRTGAVVPFIVFVTVVVLFNIFMLDTTVRKTLEFIGEKVVGAEVNIDSVDISFKDLSVKVNRIQLTDAKQPDFNIVEIGEIRFALMWDAILRAKIVINESVIENIMVNTKRDFTGDVYPTNASTESEKVAQQTFSNAKEEFQGNVVGDISALLAGDPSKDVLGNIEGSLKSKAFYDNLEKQLATKEAELKELVANLPKGDKTKELEARFKSINWDGLKDIKQAPKILKEADSLRSDINGTVKEYDNALKRVESEIAYINNAKKQAESLIDEDIKAIENKMSIPNLDTNAIAGVLFGPELVDRFRGYNKYFEMAKKYMPPKKDNKTVTNIKNPRGEGRDYQFGTPNSYPMFWLKMAKISSENEQGNVQGSIQDITTDQLIINKPTKFLIDGNFSSQGINGVKLQGVFDHRQMINDSIKLNVGTYPVLPYTLSDSESVKFQMTKAIGSIEARANLVQERLTISADNVFSNTDYLVESNNKVTKELFDEVASKARRVTVGATATGTIESLSFKIQSNLADIIKQSVSAVLQRKIDEVRAKIKNVINDKIGSQKKAVDEKTAQFKEQYKGEIDKHKGAVSKLTSQIDQKKDAGQNSVKDKAKDALKDLKKKFKF